MTIKELFDSNILDGDIYYIEVLNNDGELLNTDKRFYSFCSDEDIQAIVDKYGEKVIDTLFFHIDNEDEITLRIYIK